MTSHDEPGAEQVTRRCRFRFFCVRAGRRRTALAWTSMRRVFARSRSDAMRTLTILMLTLSAAGTVWAQPTLSQLSAAEAGATLTLNVTGTPSTPISLVLGVFLADPPLP